MVACKQPTCFGISLGSLWDDFRITLGSLWDDFSITLGSLWDHFGITLGLLWGYFGVILGSLWDHFGITLGTLQASCRGHFEGFSLGLRTNKNISSTPRVKNKKMGPHPARNQNLWTGILFLFDTWTLKKIGKIKWPPRTQVRLGGGTRTLLFLATSLKEAISSGGFFF